MTTLDRVYAEARRVGHVTVTRHVLEEVIADVDAEARSSAQRSEGTQVMMLLAQVADQNREIERLKRMLETNLLAYEQS